jgi:DnaJ family protein C protein 7
LLPISAPQDADEVTIKAAFERLAQLHHPDKIQGSEESAEKFKLVGAAYSK